MKDQKNDSTSVLSRFGRDKRTRSSERVAERVERRPRSQRDAADSEHKSEYKSYDKPRRASYNPHFTEDNRPVFGDKKDRGFGEHSSYGRKPFAAKGGRHFDNRNNGDNSFGERNAYDKPYGERNERSFSDRKFQPKGKPSYATYAEAEEYERDSKPFAKKSYGERSDRPYGKQNANRKFSDRKFDRGDRNSKFGERNDRRGYGDRKFNNDKPAYPKYNPDKQNGAIRLNRFIAQSGICSRREADDFILAGVVSVNGVVVSELGAKVLPTDEVRFNDSRIQGEKKVYLVLNKPKGYVTSLEDPHADKTVMDLVKGACSERIYPVGRLDKNSLGLLLFTNDGNLTKQLTHPAFQKKKIYQVSLDKPLTRTDMDRLAEGITLEDGEIYADEVSYVSDDKQEIGIEIHSGRNRIVRRMFEFLGYEVKKLDRVYYAGLTKKNLKRGMWRFLTNEEVQRLKSGQYE